MKNKLKNYLLLAGLLVLGLTSCRKDKNGVFAGKGAPVITSIRTVAKTDTLPTGDFTTYDSTGTASTTPGYNRTTIAAFDSTTVTGKLSNLYAILGQNLGSTTTIVINGVSIPFNRALNSDNTVIFTIPQTLPTGPDQTNKIVLTTLYGSVSYDFTVLSPPPTIISASDYNFWANSTIKLVGTGFKTVTGVGLKGGSETATIVSIVGDTVLNLKMPASTLNTTNLVFTYGAGTQTSSQEFVDLDNAYTIFYKDNFQNSWSDNSWSHPSGTSTEASHSGTASIRANYPAGAWQIEGWAGWSGPQGGLPYSADYKYLTFWVKGGVADHTLVLVGDKMAGGYGQVQNANAYAAQLIKVPAHVWTYYKIPLGPPSSTNVNLLNYWANGDLAQQLGFFLQGMGGDVDEVMYFDEVAFVK